MDDEEERWAATGRWDVVHVLMPMATYHLSPEQRKAYAVGYRSGPLGTKPNPYLNENRPSAKST